MLTCFCRPTLSAAGSGTTATRGAVLGFCYALGLGRPFVGVGLLLGIGPTTGPCLHPPDHPPHPDEQGPGDTDARSEAPHATANPTADPRNQLNPSKIIALLTGLGLTGRDYG